MALALAFPSPDLHLLSWVALVPLFVVARHSSAAQAWWSGVVFGLVFRAGTMYWVVQAMTRFGGLPLPAALAGAAALFGYLAIFPGLFMLALRRLGPASATTPLLAGTVWVGLEFLQGRLFTGFPWLLLGYAGGRSELLLQNADLAGVYGLGFLVVVVNGALATLALDGRKGWRPALATATLLVLALGYGAVRLAEHQPSDRHDLRVGLAQGNVAQDEKWDAGRVEAIRERYLDLTARAAADGADVVVWPESAWPDPWGLERSVVGVEDLRALARTSGTSVLVGTVRVIEEQEGVQVANAAVLLGADGRLAGAYEKVQLVPFGEYLPFRRWLTFLGPLVQAVGELRAGDADQPLLADPVAGLPPVGLSICYEIIFPSIAREHVRAGAELLATITNDAWYGRSSAPWQHFLMARMRAVENRRWLLRAANTGISGIIDPAGRVTARSELFEEALVSGGVRPRTGLTPYARFGDAFAWACLFVGALAVARGAALGVRGERPSR